MDNPWHLSVLNYIFVDKNLRFVGIQNWIGLLFGLIAPLIVASLKGNKFRTFLYFVTLSLSMLTLTNPSMALLLNPVFNLLLAPFTFKSLTS